MKIRNQAHCGRPIAGYLTPNLRAFVPPPGSSRTARAEVNEPWERF
jgi:hypothetical protein